MPKPPLKLQNGLYFAPPSFHSNILASDYLIVVVVLFFWCRAPTIFSRRLIFLSSIWIIPPICGYLYRTESIDGFSWTEKFLICFSVAQRFLFDKISLIKAQIILQSRVYSAVEAKVHEVLGTKFLLDHFCRWMSGERMFGSLEWDCYRNHR